MKALILHGSPRKNSNTLKLTNEFIRGLEDYGCDVEFINVCSINVNPCTECLYCETSGKCIIKDDMQIIYSKIEESDIVVLSSPIFFAGFPAQLKMVIDRCQTLYGRKYILKINNNDRKRGYIIFTGGNKSEKMVGCMELSADFFFKSFNCDFQKSIYALSVDKVPIDEREDILNEAYEEGKRAAKKY